MRQNIKLGFIPSESNPLANVPTFTEEELEVIHKRVSEKCDPKDYTIEEIVAMQSVINKTRPIPTKQPWGQAEFLTQLAKWGTMEGVEVKGPPNHEEDEWQPISVWQSEGYIATPWETFAFSEITHIRINNGEPVETRK